MAASYEDPWLDNAVMASGHTPGAVSHHVNPRTGRISHFSVRVPIGSVAGSLARDARRVELLARRTVDPLAEGLGRDMDRLEDASLHVPVAGALLHGVLVISEQAVAGPFIIAYQIANGKRIDRVLFSQLQRQAKALREVGPYVQTAISFIPGIGPGVSGGIAAGLALASGRPIDEAVIAAARAAVPGGPLAQVVFDMARAAATGKPLEDVLATGAMDGLNAAGVTIPDEARRGIMAGVHAASKIARGEPVDQAIADTAVEGLSAIPGFSPAAAKATTAAFKTGIALAHGQKLQQALRVGIPDAMGAIADMGAQISIKSPTISATVSLVPKGTENAFHAAIGLMHHNAGPVEIAAARSSLGPREQMAFDMGVSLRIGETTHGPTPTLTDRERAGYLLVKGMMGATEEQRVSMIAQIKDDPEARRGAVLAIKEVANAREPWWSKVKEALGLTA